MFSTVEVFFTSLVCFFSGGASPTFIIKQNRLHYFYQSFERSPTFCTLKGVGGRAKKIAL